MNESSPQETSVTQWMEDAIAGDENAKALIWNRYFERLINVAKTRLPLKDKRIADEEDVVLEAFNAFFCDVSAERLGDKANREDLWRILVAITERKAIDLIRKNRRAKRGGGLVRGHSFAGTDNDGFVGIPDPSPDFADEFNDTCEHLLQDLTQEQRVVALKKLAGFTNLEIANELGCVEESVRRKVVLIRKKWTKHFDLEK